jgi:hypothetical protein
MELQKKKKSEKVDKILYKIRAIIKE